MQSWDISITSNHLQPLSLSLNIPQGKTISNAPGRPKKGPLTARQCAKLATMSANDKDLLQRQMTLLKKVEGKGIRRASEFFEARESAPPEKKESPFETLFPDAARLSTASGESCRLLRSELPIDGTANRQGYRCPVAPFGGPPDPATLAELTGDARWRDVDPARVIYLDTETTGLGIGAGTHAFLVGLGSFSGDRFVLEQYFMEDYAAESALVEAVERVMDSAHALVSYNGRTFDVPLLESRFRMQRRRPRFPELHLDLLHFSRRLWRLRLENCTLGTVERDILGIERLSDVPGSMVPQIFFDFLDGKHPEQIVPVIDHHAQDIFSLGALLAAISQALTHPDDPRFAHTSDQWGLARIHLACDRMDQAIERMEAAVLAARDEDQGYHFSMQLACHYRRLGRVDDAVDIWQARSCQCRPGRIEALVELAKHAEHRLKDPTQAIGHTRRALAVLEEVGELARLLGGRQESPVHRHTGDLEALRHRLARLQRKANRLA